MIGSLEEVNEKIVNYFLHGDGRTTKEERQMSIKSRARKLKALMRGGGNTEGLTYFETHMAEEFSGTIMPTESVFDDGVLPAPYSGWNTRLFNTKDWRKTVMAVYRNYGKGDAVLFFPLYKRDPKMTWNPFCFDIRKRFYHI